MGLAVERKITFPDDQSARTRDQADGIPDGPVVEMVDPKQSDGGNRRGAIAGLAIAVILIAGGLWLAHALSAQSKLQDCLMSGRTNCNVIENPPR
jgi:hypothetical protein